MSNVPAADQRSQGTLRGDLTSVIIPGSKRASRIIIDEVSGRFVRVAEHIWQRLLGGVDDPELWQQAKAAGWTRERSPIASRRFSPLFFRIPVLSIDSTARMIARVSGPVFSTTAIIAWTMVIATAVVVAASRSSQLLASLGSLRLFLQQANPIWFVVIFVSTKIIHELAHAVMCRRMGARCGRIGLLMLCGIPCPYCDVTEVWRLPSAFRRAAVMMAGIYVELILAAIATFVWAVSTDTLLGLTALNVMVVCGVSTVLFNANPLMRYDGYYVLADLVGSVNLRAEAQSAWRSVVTCRIAGGRYETKASSDRRVIALSAYHAASTVYRITILIAIASFLIAIAGTLQLRSIAVGFVMMAAILAIVKHGRRWIGMIRGDGRWQRVPIGRRGVVASGFVFALLAILLSPMPRYRQSDGFVDVADATSVFLPVDGLVRGVTADFGQQVDAGERLLTVDNEELPLEETRLQGELRVAKLRSDLSRRVTLDRVETAQQWKTLQAAEDAVAVRLASTRKQLKQMQVAATRGGIVVPPDASVTPGDTASVTLRDREGTAAQARNAWCRISHDGRLHAVFELDARDRAEIDVGSRVMICRVSSPERAIESTVASVSAIEKDEPSVMREASYRVVCPMPTVEDQEVLQWMGSECRGVFHLKSSSCAQDLVAWWSDWIHA